MGAFLILILVFALGIGGLTVASLWILFQKAGRPVRAAIVPVYNMIVWLKVTRRPVWWPVFLLIPYVNIVFDIILTVRTATVFGKGGGFAVGMVFLPFVFLPILAFSDARYVEEYEI